MKRSHGLSRSQCRTGKRRFRDHAEAAQALGSIRSKSTRTDVPTRVYECGSCKGWHLARGDERKPPGQRAMVPRDRAPIKRQRRPIAQRSEVRQQVMANERVPFVLDVLARRPWCEAKLPWVCTGRSTDVNELMRGIWRTDCWLDDARVTSVCGGCHGFITDHPRWAKGHGQQVEQCVDLPVAFGVAEELRRLCDCPRVCTTDHRLVGV